MNRRLFFVASQEENRELQRLVVDIASDKQTAAERLATLKARHSQLSAQVTCAVTPSYNGATNFAGSLQMASRRS